MQEHLAFTGGVVEAAHYLQPQEEITYEDFCKVYEILFSGFYLWAGRDRQSLEVGRRISKGSQAVSIKLCCSNLRNATATG